MNTATQGHVLVVDDEEGIRRLLERLLSARNYAVTLAGTLAEALSAMQSQPIDVVILDLQLGEEKSGLQLLHAVRGDRSTSRVPVIILTGLRLDDADEEEIRSESAYVFYKPIDTEALLLYVDRLNRSRPDQAS